MNLLDRLIGRAVGRLPSRRGTSLVSVDADGLLIANNGVERRRKWEEIGRVSATSAAGFVAETALLAIGFTDGNVLVVPETEENWNGVTEVLFRLPGAQSATEWRLRLLAAPSGTVDVYRRG